MSILNRRPLAIRLFIGVACAVVLGTLTAMVPQNPNTLAQNTSPARVLPATAEPVAAAR